MSGLRQRVLGWLNDVSFDVVANKVLGASIVPRPVRRRALRALGVKVAAAGIGPGCYFGTRNVEIGVGALIGREVYLDGAARISIGPGAGVGPRSMIITGAHSVAGADRRVGPLTPRPVRIEAGAWLGAHVMVLPGVTIGAGCVVGAGSVVVRDCAPHGVYVGVPATRVRDIDAATATATGPAADPAVVGLSG